MSPVIAKTPSDAELAACLGTAVETWEHILAAVTAQVGPVQLEWRPSKSGVGCYVMVKQKKRTLLYLTPEPGAVRVAVVLGERALGLAMAGDLPQGIKQMFREATSYVEGTGIRFLVPGGADVATVQALLAIKTTPP